jgi:hypothetical protein
MDLSHFKGSRIRALYLCLDLGTVAEARLRFGAATTLAAEGLTL